jgi:hypothetical protein
MVRICDTLMLVSDRFVRLYCIGREHKGSATRQAVPLQAEQNTPHISLISALRKYLYLR